MKTPFTTEQFFSVFEQYNQAVFPAQLVIFLLALLCVALLHSKITFKDKLVGSFIGFLWIWTGAVYHIGFFAVINPIARIFGALFILEGLLILFSTFKNRLHFPVNHLVTDYLGYFFILFGGLLYPLIGLAIHIEPAQTISLGLPCPTGILTFGLFMLARKQFPMYLIIIPVLWAIVGLFAAINFGVYQDFMLIISAVSALFLIYAGKKNLLKYESYS